MFRRLMNPNDPVRKKKEEIKKMIEDTDKEVRRTAPALLDEQRIQSFSDDLKKAKDLILDIKELHHKQCKDLTNQIRGIENELENRWQASRNNPKSSNWIPPLPKNKTDGNGRTSVTQVNEKAQSKEHKYRGNGRSDIAKVHGCDTPEREPVTAKYYDRNHTKEMLSAGSEVLKSYERDFVNPPKDYTTASNRSSSRISANFALSKPPAVNSSDFKIHSHKDGSHKIPKPLQPEYRGNVQESSDVDRKISTPITTSILTNIDHLHNQLDRHFKAENDETQRSTSVKLVLNQNSYETHSGNGSGHVKPSYLDAEKNVQLQTSDGFESKMTSQNVKEFFKQYDEHNRKQVEQTNQIATEQNSYKPIAASDSSQLEPVERTEAKVVEQTQRNLEHQSRQSSENVYDVKLMDGSSSRLIEASRSNRYAEPDLTQHARRDHEHPSSHSSEPVKLTTQNAKVFFMQHDDRSQVEQQTNRCATASVQNSYKPIAASDSRQLEPVERTEAKVVEQTQRNLEHQSRQSSENVYDVELMDDFSSGLIEASRLNRYLEPDPTQHARRDHEHPSSHYSERDQNAGSITSSRSTEAKHSNRNAEEDTNKYVRRDHGDPSIQPCEPVHNAELISGSDLRQLSEPSEANQFDQHSLRSCYENSQSTSNSNHARRLERNQVHEVPSNQNKTLSYAGVVSKQTSQHGNPHLHRNQNNYSGHHSSRSANPNEFSYRPSVDERHNPNSIVQNISYGERRPDQKFYQHQHAHNYYYGSNQYYNYRQYPPAAGYQKFAGQCYFNSQHPNLAHVIGTMEQEQRQPEEVEMVEEEEEEEEQQPEKPKIITDEIQDLSGHFQNDDLKKNKDKMPKDEYMALVRSKAEKFEPQIIEAEAFDFMEFFIIDENLNQFIQFLDATHTRDSKELTQQKIEIIVYIKGLQEKLDEKRSD